jgi:hypothetical protein
MSEDPGTARPRPGSQDLPALIEWERARQIGARAVNQCPACETPLTAVYDDEVLDVVDLWRQVD